MPSLDAYLDQICSQMQSCPPEVRLELRQHLEQTVATLRAAGDSPARALELAIREFGDPGEIGAFLASVHDKGGVAMVRRVVFPAMLAVGVWLAVSLAGLLQEGWLLVRNPAPLALLLIPRSLSWVIFVGTFLALHLCVARGGSRREAILVGMSPFLATSPAAFQLLLGPLVALVRGPASREALAVTHGHFIALSSVIGLAGTCLAAIWLYFFMARQMHSRPSSAIVEQ